MRDITVTIQRCDIFCTVIDNFGDIGVCWRLARQLQHEQQIAVRLFVDELAALKMICPQALITGQQWLEGIEVYRWQPQSPESTQPDADHCAADFSAHALPDLVIESFACELPVRYIQAMVEAAAAGRAPKWLNLEYLALEDWADDCHGLRSVHPANGLAKHFYFPGFSPKTGGLLCESTLFAARDQWQASPAQRDGLLSQLGVDSLGFSGAESPLLVSLFAYPNTAVDALLQAFGSYSRPVLCLVPEGKILPQVAAFFGHTSLKQGDSVCLGNLTVQVLPFMEQRDYDALLWSCDLNLVRGEDSFVRAQWAGQPLIWHIYPQEESAHLVKLDAFLARYLAALPQPLAEQVNASWQAWNRPELAAPQWHRLLDALPEWRAQSRRWAAALYEQGDLVAKMRQFLAKCEE
ncbi:elongation factor P maturation arginine rhamnosyltransferase EarP [Pokkaliibacter sp. CJK22405]|uniref:elongation factor P maturation arginine rhamnosyltransferase EarP n=1 Tax=Pokkaliibacter sp. CJK22405 TaxID=3384615 RepID=UPI00398503BA